MKLHLQDHCGQLSSSERPLSLFPVIRQAKFHLLTSRSEMHCLQVLLGQTVTTNQGTIQRYKKKLDSCSDPRETITSENSAQQINEMN